MSVFEPLEKTVAGGTEKVFLQSDTKEVKALNIIDAIQQHENPEEIISAVRGIKIPDTDNLYQYTLKLQKVIPA